MSGTAADIHREVAVARPLDLEVNTQRTYGPRLLKAFVMVADAVAVALGLLGAYGISRGFRPFDSLGATPICLVVGAATLPMWVWTFSRYGLYKARRVAARLDEGSRIVHATLASTLLTAATSFLLKLKVSRGWLILSFPAVLITCLIEREFVRATFARLHRSGRSLRRVVVVGANDEGASICELLRPPALGYRVVGIVDDDDAQTQQPLVLGPIDDTLNVVRATGATGVMVATTALSTSASNRLVRELIEAGIHVEMTSSLRDIGAERLRVRPLGTTPVVYVEPIRRGGWRALAKRTFDMACSGMALMVLSPLLALVAVAIRLDSRGRVFFSQVRVGRDGKPFRVHKFRTMVSNAEALLPELKERNEADGPLFKVRRDPRITRLGRLLRRFSVDELPQLVNVLRGEMSLVGPRPALYSEMAGWTPELTRSRFRVRPGLTGMWQVSGRSDLSFADYTRFDLYYVDNWSLWRDLAILAKTVPVVLGNRGGY